MGCNMYTYCLSNPVNMVDINGEHPEWLLELAEETGSMASAASIAGEYRKQTVVVKSTKQKPNFTPNPNKRKGSENRQPTGERERNVGHPEGEEHSRVAKGNNRVRRTQALLGVTATSLVIVAIVADDATLVGIINDTVLLPTIVAWWDYASEVGM